jgi:hypothetical protein
MVSQTDWTREVAWSTESRELLIGRRECLLGHRCYGTRADEQLGMNDTPGFGQ